MSLYFLLLDAGFFQDQLQPALAASWRARSFAPCRPLCQAVRPSARVFAERYHAPCDDALLMRLAEKEIGFDRDLWRHLIGELLLYSAVEIPELQTAPETLCCLLAPGHYRAEEVARACFTPIQQAHYGSRDLVFGGGYYRPDQAGLNDVEDVTRLADYLAEQDPADWTLARLEHLREVEGDNDRADELEYAREWYPALVALYRKAREQGQVVVCEVL